jgi:hypothetical protein
MRHSSDRPYWETRVLEERDPVALPSEVQFVAKGLVVIIAVSAGDVSARISEFLSRSHRLNRG